MEQKKHNKKLYTQEQVVGILADVLSDLVIELKDPSLFIASMLAMDILYKKLK